MLLLMILKILEQYSDENHPLTHKQIIEYLYKNYNVECDRRTVARHIMTLYNFGDYDIVKCKRGTYINRIFENSDLRLLIDSVLFSPFISSEKVRQLIEKLSSLGTEKFKSKFKHTGTFYIKNLRHSDNTEVMNSVDAIDEAINKSKKITFTYNHYERINNIFQLRPRKNKLYKVSPYQMVIATGRYYLIANTDGHDNISHYRIDKIKNVVITDEPLLSNRNIKEIANGGLNLPRHMAEHLYMFGGESILVKFWIHECITDSLVDWFGTGQNYKILQIKDNRLLIEVKINYIAMKFWAMQFSEYVEIISPTNLREELKNVARKMLNQYS